jgi:hypothetical protein
MKIKNKYQQHICTEYTVVVEHEGTDYRWTGWITESSNGEDWFLNDKVIEQPDWAEDMEMWDINAYKEVGVEL